MNEESKQLSYGTPIVLRHVLKGKTWCALPVTFLADTGDELVLKIHAGTVWLAAHDDYGRRVHGWASQWSLERTVWRHNDLTYVIPWGMWFGIAMFTKPGSVLINRWSINCQDPIRRNALGYETMDRELDIVFTSKSCRGVLKDVKEFRRIVAEGVLTRSDVRALLHDAREGIRLLSSLDTRTRIATYLTSRELAVPQLGTYGN